jgi:hypothetical protein
VNIEGFALNWIPPKDKDHDKDKGKGKGKSSSKKGGKKKK